VNRIGRLYQRCGYCCVSEFCGDAFYYCLCHDDRFKDMDETKYKELAEKIDWSDWETYPPCVNCDENCDKCEEQSEKKDAEVRFIADKVSELLKDREGVL
jgi:hypothetical protein